MTESDARSQLKRSKSNYYSLKQKVSEAQKRLSILRNKLAEEQKNVDAADTEVRKFQARLSEAKREYEHDQKTLDDILKGKNTTKSYPKPNFTAEEDKESSFWYWVKRLVPLVTLIGGLLAILNHLHLL